MLNLALAFYNVGTIWAHEADIFRSWKLLDSKIFPAVQAQHWRRLPYWVFIPVGLSFIGAVLLFWYHPGSFPLWQIWAAFLLQLTSHLLTALLWGPWQAKLSKDSTGGKSQWLSKILKTHWVRTLLITGYAVMLLLICIEVIT